MGWRTLDILRAVTVAVAVYFALRALWGASTVLLVIFLGVLFGLALSTGVDRLARWRIPRALGAALAAEGVLHHVFCQRQVVHAEDSRERGDHAARLAPEEVFAEVRRLACRHLGRSRVAKHDVA
jgi:hypothetical protein